MFSWALTATILFVEILRRWTFDISWTLATTNGVPPPPEIISTITAASNTLTLAGVPVVEAERPSTFIATLLVLKNTENKG